MKPTELQIGDWVLIDNTPRQVVQLTKSKVGYHTEPNECRMHYARHADVEPIRITAEILEKNEFKYSSSIRMWLYGVGNKYGIGVGLWGDCGVHVKCYKQGENYMRKMHLPYTPFVHQLQQAIRLCGIDKKIEV